MKKLLIVLIALLFVTYSKAQTNKISELDTADNSNLNIPDKSPDLVPRFPGGLDKFTEYLSSNIHYPESAKKNHIQGIVFVEMVIERDGRVTDAKIFKSVSPDLDREALRVVSSSPRWIPGVRNGKVVKVDYKIPIDFSLTGFPTNEQVEDPIYTRVDVAAEFPGGTDGFKLFIKKNLRFPTSLTETEGNVRVTFVVETDGSLTHPHIMEDFDDAMNVEALKIISMSPKWKPALIDNVAVRSYGEVAIPFKLEDK